MKCDVWHKFHFPPNHRMCLLCAFRKKRFNYHPQNDLFVILQPTLRLLWMPKRKKNCRHEWSGKIFSISLLAFSTPHRIYCDFKNAASILNLNFKRVSWNNSKKRVLQSQVGGRRGGVKTTRKLFLRSQKFKCFGEALNFNECAMRTTGCFNI